MGRWSGRNWLELSLRFSSDLFWSILLGHGPLENMGVPLNRLNVIWGNYDLEVTRSHSSGNNIISGTRIQNRSNVGNN